MAVALSVFPAFDVHGEGDVAHRFNKWVDKLKNLFVGANIMDHKRKRALMLHYAGDEVYEIFQSLTDTGEDFDTAYQKLKEYFEPKKTVAFAVYNFRQAKQQRDESIDVYVTRLRNLAKVCEFNDSSLEIKHQIIQNCSSQSLRRKALKDDSLTLDQTIIEARSLELSNVQVKKIEGETVAQCAQTEKLSTEIATKGTPSKNVSKEG